MLIIPSVVCTNIMKNYIKCNMLYGKMYVEYNPRETVCIKSYAISVVFILCCHL